MDGSLKHSCTRRKTSRSSTSAAIVPVELVTSKISADPRRATAQRRGHELAVPCLTTAPPGSLGHDTRSFFRREIRKLLYQTREMLHVVNHAGKATQGVKRDAYFDAGVAHYWLVNPDNQTLTILERTDRGYLILRVAGPGDTVRAPPFEGVEIAVEELFMDEEGELAGEAGAAEETRPAAEQAPPARAEKPPAQKRSPRRRKA